MSSTIVLQSCSLHYGWVGFEHNLIVHCHSFVNLGVHDTGSIIIDTYNIETITFKFCLVKLIISGGKIIAESLCVNYKLITIRE